MQILEQSEHVSLFFRDESHGTYKEHISNSLCPFLPSLYFKGKQLFVLAVFIHKYAVYMTSFPFDCLLYFS